MIQFTDNWLMRFAFELIVDVVVTRRPGLFIRLDAIQLALCRELVPVLSKVYPLARCHSLAQV